MIIPTPPVRPLVYLLVTAGFVGAGIDVGSIALTRLAVPDDVRSAGHAAAAAVEGKPVTRQTASLAFAAATEEARPRGLTLRTEDFTLYPDGRVTLTGSRTAPTLLLARVASLRQFTEVESTVTITALPFS